MWKLIRIPLFALPVEFAHSMGMRALKASAPLNPNKKTYPLQLQSGVPNFLNVLNPIGLAAGLDKNAEVLLALPSLGFGYAEIGTITPIPQGGNEKPRMFRNAKTESLFNRMGFNNLGAGIVSERLRKAKPHLPADFKVGVNLGKNKITADADAASDYAKVASAFLDCADYFVINVSSPNTPGLRSLQSQEALIPIVKAVQEVVAASKDRKIPILVKLSPELVLKDPEHAYQGLLKALEDQKIDGLVLTNTIQGEHIYRGRALSGGWSGRCLTEMSYEALVLTKKLTSLPIISVGGIHSTEEVKKRFAAGASLVQIYSAWVYEGPYFIRKLIRNLKKS